METLTELTYRIRALKKLVDDFKAIEYPDNSVTFYNNQRAGIIHLSRVVYLLSKDLPVKEA